MKLTGRQHLIVLSIVVLGVLAPAAEAFAQARPREFDPDLLRSGDLIRYRELDTDDFLAADPPPEAAALHGRLGAATCVFLATDPSTSIRAVSRDADHDARLVRAHIESLGFIAYMDRECSWWNPAPLALPREYILQHEQIHFALFEAAARKLNDRVDEMMLRMQTVATSQREAVEIINRQIDAELRAAIGAVLSRSNLFDRETSRTYRQDRQNWWWETVSRELGPLTRAPS